MVILIAGATHTGKTHLARQLVEKYHYSCLSIDHLKMGLIRSGQTKLTVFQDAEMGEYLWPILREMIKTAIENCQDLILEGCYIPFSWREDFTEEYLREIEYRCLIMSESYIRNYFDKIKAYANVAEARLDDSDLEQQALILENARNLAQCKQYGCEYCWIDEDYCVTPESVGL